MNTFLRSTLAAAALTGIMVSSVAAAPARADGPSTTRTIIGIVAGIAAIATAANVESKHAKANTVVGYLQDGSTVFADGHVVDRNGNSWYPGNQGLSIGCNGQNCYIYNGNNNGNGNGYQYNNGNGNGYQYNNGNGNGYQYNNGYQYQYQYQR